MKLSDLLHITLPEGAPSRQKRLGKMLALFLAAMLLLTVLSRAADSLTVAQVQTESPKSGAVEHIVEGEGTLSAVSEAACVTLSGILVESVPVYEGAAVKSGDVLFTLSVSDLQEKLREKELEKQKLQLQIQQTNLTRQSRQEQDAISLERAQEDYEYALRTAKEDVRRAQNDLQEARDDIDDFWWDHDRDDFDDWEDDEDSWDSDYTLGDSETRSQAEQELAGLLEKFQSAKRALQDATLAQEKALRDAQRQIDDAARDPQPDLQPQILALSLEAADTEIQKLRLALENEGKITALFDGVITSLRVSTGTRTSDEAAAVIARTAEGFLFRTTLDSDEAKYASRGDKAEVVPYGKQRGEETTIESLSPAGEGGGMQVIARVREGDIGQSATLRLTKRSESYPICLPLSAIHGATGDQYVLVVDERETVLGVEKVARKVSVTVQDQSDTRAAVEGALQNSDQVIVSSSKNIFEGDRVRLVQP